MCLVLHDNDGIFVLLCLQINNFERVAIRCVINHWSPNAEEDARLRTVGWQHKFHQPIFEEDREFLSRFYYLLFIRCISSWARLNLLLLDRMKRHKYGKKASKREDNKDDLQLYKEWRKRRDLQLRENTNPNI